MLNRLQTRPRLLLLILALTLVMIASAVTAVQGLRAAGERAAQLNRNSQAQALLNQMKETLRDDVLAAVNDASSGRIAWEQARLEVSAARNLITSLWDEYQTGRTPQQIAALSDALGKHHALLLLTFTGLENIFLEQDFAQLASFQEFQLKRALTPFIAALDEQAAQLQLESEINFQQSTSAQWGYILGSLAITVAGLLSAAMLGLFVYRSIEQPAPLDARQEHDQLDSALDALMRSMSKLDGRDLTIKLPMAEGIAGSIAGAVNQVTGETAQVMIDVRRIVEHVVKVAVMVRTQSDIVSAVAANEHCEIDETARVLEQAAVTLKHITEWAQICEQAAAAADQATHTALQSAADSVDGMNTMRSSMHDTAKRIKQLGVHSHDMERATHLMNGLAERTHIVALNACMHAAAAGDGGRGFAAIAHEVQCLAESARAATQQIAVMVSALQTETNAMDLIVTNAITQAVAGSDFAERSGEHMLHSRNSTVDLVKAVHQIAQGAARQIQLSTQLHTRAQSLKTSTRKTHEQMQEYIQHTQRMAQYSKALLTAVRVFTLPGEDEEAPLEQSGEPPVSLKMRAS